MAKPKKTQNHFGTSLPHARKMYESEDEDICPVCEGECTCNNIAESITACSFEEFSRQQQSKAASSSAATSSKITSALPKGFRPSSSKGLGPASYATVVTSPSPASKVAPRLQSLKLKIPSQSKHDGDHTLSDSSNSTIDAPSGPQLARFNISKHANGGGSGSITPRHALDDRISPTNGHSSKAVPPKVIAKSKGKGKQPIDRKPAPTTKKAAAATVKKPTVSNPKKPTLVNSKKRKLGRPHKKRIRDTTSESSLSDFDDFDEDDFVPFRGSGPANKGASVEPTTGFPTFVSASVFGDSEEEQGSSSSSDSETTGLVLSGDSEVEEEEERMIVAEEKKERQRKFKELIMNTSHKNHMGGGAGGQQWQIKPRRKSVEGEESVDDETTSESGVGEEEEEEDEDDPDEEDPDGEEQAAAWSTDDSDEDLFFANLSDSSISFSADQDDDDDSETVSSTADLAEAASAGFLSGMGGMPMVVMDDFGMEFSLGGVLNATDLDQEFEQRARAQLAEEKRTPGRETASPELDVFSATDYTREALEAVDGLEMDLDSDATEYEEDSDMDGDTTADEMERGRTPARFRFPTPPSINPLSTFSPSPAVSPVGWRDFTPTHFAPPLFMRGAAPVTPHARAASFGGFGGLDAARGRTISASAVLVNGSDGSVSASEVSSTRPVMGSFGRTGDRRRAAIIDGNAAVPSPFAGRRRRSDSWKSGRKHFGSKSDIFPMLARRARGNSNATSGSTQFPTTETEFDMDMDMDMEESCTEPFGLDDVLDFSNVSDDHSHHPPQHVCSPTDEDEAHLRSLDRWDRVPMGTFRRTRETHDAGAVPNVSTPDGFSYGASSRSSWKEGVLWGGGLSVLGEGKEMLGPVGAGDNLGNSEDVAEAGQFEKAMSRKERRHRKKREAASTHVPTKSFITPPPSRKQ